MSARTDSRIAEAIVLLSEAIHAANVNGTSKSLALQAGLVAREIARAHPERGHVDRDLVMETVAACVIEAVKRGGDDPATVAKQVVAAFVAAEEALKASSPDSPDTSQTPR